MKRTTALALSILTLLAASGYLSRTLAKESPPRLLPASHQAGNGSQCIHCQQPLGRCRCGPSAGMAAHGFSVCGNYSCRHGGGCARCGCHNGALARAMASGQPVIDPWARADWIAANRAAAQSWHAGYYHTQWGVPLALVVPPTARMQTRYSWGVAQSTMSPIYQQFERPYPGGPMGIENSTVGLDGNPLQPTPRWPSHTDQFGVYYVRGPW